MTATRLPVVTWHSIANSNEVIATSPEVFAQQMSWLNDAGLRGICLAEAYASRNTAGEFPPDVVALTFDDGFADVITHALPQLRRHGFSATFFITNEYLGMPQMMPESAVTELSREGMEIGAHTLTHPDLRKLSEAELLRELREGRHHLEQLTGQEVHSFAYPFGYYNQKVSQAAAHEYEFCCTTRLGYVSAQTPQHLIPRLDAYYLGRERLWLQASRGLRPWWWQLRQLPRDLKDAFA